MDVHWAGRRTAVRALGDKHTQALLRGEINYDSETSAVARRIDMVRGELTS